MVIRDAQPADFDAIAEITNHYILTTAIHFGYEAQTGAELRAMWEKGRERYPFVVLEDDAKQVVGYAKAGVWRERAAYARTAEVGIYLRPGLTGKGWGKRLYARLIEDCRAKGLHSLVAGATLPNEASVRLHESVGFVRVGAFKEAGWKHDKWHDVGFWQLML